MTIKLSWTLSVNVELHAVNQTVTSNFHFKKILWIFFSFFWTVLVLSALIGAGAPLQNNFLLLSCCEQRLHFHGALHLGTEVSIKKTRGLNNWQCEIYLLIVHQYIKLLSTTTDSYKDFTYTTYDHLIKIYQIIYKTLTCNWVFLCCCFYLKCYLLYDFYDSVPVWMNHMLKTQF